MANTTTTEIDVGGHEQHHEGPPPSFFAPDVTLLILTWITFFSLLAILYKFAWKPILAALDAREETIKRSLGEAQRLKDELSKIEESRLLIIKEAQNEAKNIVEASRKAATEAAHHIQQKAKEENQILLENARREIKNETEKAQAFLKQESIDIALGLASKLIEENLDDKKNRQLINSYIKES